MPNDDKWTQLNFLSSHYSHQFVGLPCEKTSWSFLSVSECSWKIPGRSCTISNCENFKQRIRGEWAVVKARSINYVNFILLAFLKSRINFFHTHKQCLFQTVFEEVVFCSGTFAPGVTHLTVSLYLWNSEIFVRCKDECHLKGAFSAQKVLHGHETEMTELLEDEREQCPALTRSHSFVLPAN